MHVNNQNENINIIEQTFPLVNTSVRFHTQLKLVNIFFGMTADDQTTTKKTEFTEKKESNKKWNRILDVIPLSARNTANTICYARYCAMVQLALFEN